MPCCGAHLKHTPGDVEAMRLLAEADAARDHFVEAERLLQQCLQLVPGHSEARLELARVLHSQQKAAPMLPLLERLLALEPKNMRYRTLHASALNLLGQNERAMRDPQDAAGPSFRITKCCGSYYGHSLRIAGRLEETVAAYRKSAQLSREFGEAWFSLANLKTVRFSEAEIATMQAQVARADLGDDAPPAV